VSAMPNTPDMSRFRERFSAELDRYGNVSRLADKAGVHRGTLYDWRKRRQEPSLAASLQRPQELGFARSIPCPVEWTRDRSTTYRRVVSLKRSLGSMSLSAFFRAMNQAHQR